MESEFSILKKRGLDPNPERGKPAGEKERAAYKAYQSALDEFSKNNLELSTYLGNPISSQIAEYLFRLLDNSRRLAGRIRATAMALDRFSSFIRTDEGALYFKDIAGAAEDAYASRIQALDALEDEFSEYRYQSSRVSPGTLKFHEAPDGGHLISAHIRQTMEDFKLRFLREPKRTQLSSFFDRSIAEDVIWRTLMLNEERLNDAFHGDRIRLYFNEPNDVGYKKTRNGPLELTNCGMIIIDKDMNQHPLMYRIVTAVLGKKKD